MDLAILALIIHHAVLNNIDPALAMAVVKVESNFKVNAVGSSHGEIGLMQLRPEYFRAYTREELFNPEVNIAVGMRYLGALKKECVHRREKTFVVCWNVGPSGAKKIKHPKLFPYYKKVFTAMQEFKQMDDIRVLVHQ